jgi:nucleoside-diphosphate-sugar epimerase
MDTDETRCVLVTGGRGFLGRAVTKLLQRTGYEVVSLDVTPITTCSGDPQNEGEVLCDLSDAGALRREFEARRIGGIVHLAAILPTAAQRDPVRATQVNVEGSLNLLEAARRFGVRRMVFGSSLSVYGTRPADQVVSETDQAAPEDLYGAAKLYVEQLGAAYRQQFGLKFVSLRIGRVVGPGARSVSSAWRSEIFEFLGTKNTTEIAVPYVGTERILVVHLDDVARMLVALLQAACPRHSIYNAACESVVVEELKDEVERLNSKLSIKLGETHASGNPRRLDSSRFQQEFGIQRLPIFEQLRAAAERG